MPRERTWPIDGYINELVVETCNLGGDGVFTIWLTERLNGDSHVLKPREARELGRALVEAADEVEPEVSDAA